MCIGGGIGGMAWVAWQKTEEPIETVRMVNKLDDPVLQAKALIQDGSVCKARGEHSWTTSAWVPYSVEPIGRYCSLCGLKQHRIWADMEAK